MNAFLEYIEIDNFKSYKGKVCIGTLKHFTAGIYDNFLAKSMKLMDNFIKFQSLDLMAAVRYKYSWGIAQISLKKI
jgi:hypothetical protein